MSTRINPAHALTFDPTTQEGQAICDLYEGVIHRAVHGNDWIGNELISIVSLWFAEHGFNDPAPLTAQAHSE